MADINKGIQGAGAGASLGSAAGPWGTAIGGVLGGAAGLLSKRGESAEEKAAKAMQEAYKNLYVPTIQDRLYQIADYSQVGELDPELEYAIQQAQSELKDVQTDPRLRQAQLDALNEFQRRSQGEVTPQVLEALNTIRQDTANQQKAQQAAILQNRAQRGMGGSGDELAAQLLASQAGAAQANQRGLQLASQADQAALQNMANSANLAASVDSQDYNKAVAAARAQDVINQFNTSQKAGVQTRNVGSRNNAQASNLNTKQNIANMNTDNSTKRSQLEQQARLGYADSSNQKALGVAGAGMPIANAKTQADQRFDDKFSRTTQSIGGMGGMFSNLFSGMGGGGGGSATTSGAPIQSTGGAYGNFGGYA